MRASRQRHVPRLAIATLLLLILAAVFAPLIAPHDPLAQDLLARFTPPVWSSEGDWAYLFGADSLGRDVFSNVLFGLRVSLLAGFFSVLISVSIGTFLGAIAGYLNGSRIDSLIMRAADVQLSLPAVLIALGVLALLGRGLWNVILVIGIVGWAQYARLARSGVLVEHAKDYAVAAVVIGASPRRVLFRHVLPNIFGPLLAQMSVDIPRDVELAATLSFLGLGVAVTTPALGLRISQGYQYLLSGVWWPSIIPGIALVVLVLCANLIGDWVRDLMDPRRRMRG